MLVQVFRGSHAATLFETAPNLHLTWQVEAAGFNDDLSLANAVFSTLNRDDRPTAQTSYSLSIGDVLLIEDRAYRVATSGFEPYDPAATQELLEDAPPVPYNVGRLTPYGLALFHEGLDPLAGFQACCECGWTRQYRGNQRALATRVMGTHRAAHRRSDPQYRDSDGPKWQVHHTAVTCPLEPTKD